MGFKIFENSMNPTFTKTRLDTRGLTCTLAKTTITYPSFLMVLCVHVQLNGLVWRLENYPVLISLQYT